MKVAKFGGSSVADSQQIAKVCDIAAADSERRVLVVSAPGKRHPEDTKVTDLLIRLAREILAGRDPESAYAAIVDRFRDIGKALQIEAGVLDTIATDLRRRMTMPCDPQPRFLDAIKAAGEDYCARLVAAALRGRGMAASYVCPCDAGMILDGAFGDGQMTPDSTARLAAALKARTESEIIVFPGFYGATPHGDIITFSRGGSDVSGAILAAALDADEYENFTDVDGVYCADPRLVPDALPIPELTYRELRELTYSGFNVFHEEAVIPTLRKGIPVHIRNTNRPDAPGTRILPRRRFKHGEVVGIAGQEGFCALYISKFLMNREIGFGRHLMGIFEEEGLSYEHIPSGIDDLSVILSSEEFPTDVERRVSERIRSELKVDNLEVERGLALIMIVGEGMHYAVGLAAKATGALADVGVNIEMLNQGSSEISMMFGVKDGDCRKAVRALFDAFFRDAKS